MTVDDSMLAHPDAADWPSHGRTRDEQRFSPLRGIDTSNVRRLGIAWSFDLGGYQKVEATPIVVGGILYATGPWSVVHALDARTGRAIWTYDPHVPRRTGARVCCGSVNRGVAVYRGRVYVGTLDGRLVAVDAATGSKSWEVMTVDTAAPYSITGAPRVGRGLVFIGNAGADFGVRGYVSAYDAETGALRWRTYTVPGNPAKGFESDAMKRAADTWRGRWWELGGGGGTVWDAIVFDPETDRVYVGTGNGSPWNRAARSPGGGDNLYLASILALNAADGALVWHYQTTPAESWDYTATQPLILADLEADGRRRRVIMQAPKNGFFYVLDRESGALLRAAPLVGVSWARGIDLVTGRPVESASSLSTLGPFIASPPPLGAHNWHPMSYSPLTGLVYLSVTQNAAVMAVDTMWKRHPRLVNRGLLIGPTADPDGTIGPLPQETLDLQAWDPVLGRVAWRVRQEATTPSGTLAVAGGLVFAGRAPRRLAAYRARDGLLLWEHSTGATAEAGPISYAVDGVQYVAVLTGNGVARSRFGAGPAPAAYRGRTRIVAFALGGRGRLPDRDPPPHARPDIAPGEMPNATPADLREGNRLYDSHCVSCHGPAAASVGPAPDLRFSAADVRRRFANIVLEGSLLEQGMPSFGGRLSEADVRRLQAYVVARARLAMRPGSAR